MRRCHRLLPLGYDPLAVGHAGKCKEDTWKSGLCKCRKMHFRLSCCNTGLDYSVQLDYPRGVVTAQCRRRSCPAEVSSWLRQSNAKQIWMHQLNYMEILPVVLQQRPMKHVENSEILDSLIEHDRSIPNKIATDSRSDPPNQDGTLEYLGHITSLWLFEWHPSLLRALPVGQKKGGSIWQSSRSCAMFFLSNLYLWLDKKTVGFCLYAECYLLYGQAHSPESVLFALSSSKGHSPKLHPADCKITFKMWHNVTGEIIPIFVHTIHIHHCTPWCILSWFILIHHGILIHSDNVGKRRSNPSTLCLCLMFGSLSSFIRQTAKVSGTGVDGVQPLGHSSGVMAAGEGLPSPLFLRTSSSLKCWERHKPLVRHL